jgi:hypothetical protein
VQKMSALSGTIMLAGACLTCVPRVHAQPKGAVADSGHEIHLPLKGEPDHWEGRKVIGRDVGDCVSFEPQGMRITLRADPARGHPNTGLVVSTPVKGDFEVTVSFEILQESNPTPNAKQPTKVGLMVYLDSATADYGAVMRRTAPTGATDFAALLQEWDPGTEQKQFKFKAAPTACKSGRLRLVRRASVLSCYAAEGTSAEFTLVSQYPFGAADLKEVQVVGSTGGPNGALDTRVSELLIRVGAAPALVVDSPQTRAAQRLLYALAVALITATGVLAVWLARLRMRPNARGRAKT